MLKKLLDDLKKDLDRLQEEAEAIDLKTVAKNWAKKADEGVSDFQGVAKDLAESIRKPLDAAAKAIQEASKDLGSAAKKGFEQEAARSDNPTYNGSDKAAETPHSPHDLRGEEWAAAAGRAAASAASWVKEGVDQVKPSLDKAEEKTQKASATVEKTLQELAEAAKNSYKEDRSASTPTNTSTPTSLNSEKKMTSFPIEKSALTHEEVLRRLDELGTTMEAKVERASSYPDPETLDRQSEESAVPQPPKAPAQEPWRAWQEAQGQGSSHPHQSAHNEGLEDESFKEESYDYQEDFGYEDDGGMLADGPVLTPTLVLAGVAKTIGRGAAVFIKVIRQGVLVVQPTISEVSQIIKESAREGFEEEMGEEWPAKEPENKE